MTLNKFAERVKRVAEYWEKGGRNYWVLNHSARMVGVEIDRIIREVYQTDLTKGKK